MQIRGEVNVMERMVLVISVRDEQTARNLAERLGTRAEFYHYEWDDEDSGVPVKRTLLKVIPGPEPYGPWGRSTGGE